MKISWLIILILFLALSAFNISSTFDGNNPSVKISMEDGEREYRAGEIIRFSIRICSADNLESFVINPELLNDENSNLKYSFNSNTKQASINYFYTVPKDISGRDIRFSFKLKDNSNEINKVMQIRIN